MFLFLVCFAIPVQAVELEISWDKDLAFESDRENYQKLLKGIVTRSYQEVSSDLGLALSNSLKVRVYTRKEYEKVFGSQLAARSGALYFRGSIHINGGNRLNDRFSGTIDHEMTHALIDCRGTSRYLPIWFNEGLAERSRWRRLQLRQLAPNQVSELKYARQQKKLIPLPSRGALTPYQYLQSYYKNVSTYFL